MVMLPTSFSTNEKINLTLGVQWIFTLEGSYCTDTPNNKKCHDTWFNTFIHSSVKLFTELSMLRAKQCPGCPAHTIWCDKFEGRGKGRMPMETEGKLINTQGRKSRKASWSLEELVSVFPKRRKTLFIRFPGRRKNLSKDWGVWENMGIVSFEPHWPRSSPSGKSFHFFKHFVIGKVMMDSLNKLPQSGSQIQMPGGGVLKRKWVKQAG